MHSFESKGSRYLFDPFSMRLAKLNKEEYNQVIFRHADIYQRRYAGRSDREKSLKAAFNVGNLSYKEIFTEPRTAARKPPLSRDVEILVNAAQTCNLVCPYCFVGQGQFHYGQKQDKGLDPRLARRLVEVLPQALPDANTFCIHFYGGEPLLNPEAMRAAVEAAEQSTRPFRFSITTNGTLCRPDIISLLKRGRFSVILSIDGPPQIHNALRKTPNGQPTHALVFKFLKLLKKEGIFVRGSSVVRRGWSLREAISYLDSLPVDLIKAQAVRLPPAHPLSLSPIEREQYFEDLKVLARSIIQGLRKRTYIRDDRFDSRVIQILGRIRRTSFCGAGRSVFGLAADGTVLPCALLAGFADADLGRIDESIDWAQKGRVWAESHGPRTECKKCWALPLCGGGCPAMLSVCGEDECDMVRANCEAALEIYGAFLKRPADLLLLAGRY